QFDHGEAVVARRVDQRNQRLAYIAADLRGQAGALEQDARERRRSRLAVRPRNADESPAQKAPGQLDFTDDLHTPLAGAPERFERERDAGTDYDQVRFFKQLRRVRPGHDLYSLRAQAVHAFQFAFRLRVVDHDVSPAREQKFRRRRATARQPDDQNVFVIKL